MSDVRELIEETDTFLERMFNVPQSARNLIRRLADALEATLQPAKEYQKSSENDQAGTQMSKPVNVDALAKVVDRAIIFPSEQAGLSNQERWEIRDEAARAVVEWMEKQ